MWSGTLVGLGLLLLASCGPKAAPTPGGPETKFTSEVCTAGVITLPCFTTPAFTLQADPVTYVQLAIATAKAFLQPVVKDLGPCVAAGNVDTTTGEIVANADVLCPSPPGQPPIRQRVTITLHPAAPGGV
jgi:hypothetical protein